MHFKYKKHVCKARGSVFWIIIHAAKQGCQNFHEQIKAILNTDGRVRKGILIANVAMSRRNNNCLQTEGLSNISMSHLPFLCQCKEARLKKKYAVMQVVGDEDATSGTISKRKKFHLYKFTCRLCCQQLNYFFLS